jgi:S-adenosylmethionine:tRNA ribosyltransferase-isomerase
MKTADFDYHLPEDLIAQTPLSDRSASRLLVLDRQSGMVQHTQFHQITDHLVSGDVLVLNDTRVMPARLFGIKDQTNALIEILLLKQIEGDEWETLVKPAKRVLIGTTIRFGSGELTAVCVGLGEEGIRRFRFEYQGIFLEVLDRLGEMPLPPYIHEKLEDRERYQTVYSKVTGSAAAPTAGLHFTEELLDHLRQKGVEIVFLTLHVGLGTFRPVQVDDVLNHKMHAEFYQLSKEAAAALHKAKQDGRNIIAVGTTSTRTLESVIRDHGMFVEASGWTDIFIYPGFQFRAIDGLITNFHLPKSTLVMLVAAFTSQEIVLNAYRVAVQERYRFFSFGDSMFIKPIR